jgi:hypothetical protein
MLKEIPAHHVPAVPQRNVREEQIVGERWETNLPSLVIHQFMYPPLTSSGIDIGRSLGTAG